MSRQSSDLMTLLTLEIYIVDTNMVGNCKNTWFIPCSFGCTIFTEIGDSTELWIKPKFDRFPHGVRDITVGSKLPQ